MLKRFTKQLLTAIFALGIMAYTAVQISMTIGDIIEVENALYASISKVLPVNAYVFRDEKAIMGGGEGTACYFFRDGEKAYKGAEVFKVYELDSDAKIQEQINELHKKIAVLERSSIIKTYSTRDLETLDASIVSRLSNIVSAVGSRKLSSASLNEDELLIYMNRRSSVITAASGYDMVIDVYKRQIQSLENSLTGASTGFTTNESGYFYAVPDGYENIFAIDFLNSMTLEQYYALEDCLPDSAVLSNSYGKMITSVKWYLTLSLDKKTVNRLTDLAGRSGIIEVRFPYSDGVVVKMKIEKVISQTNYDTSVMVISTFSHIDNFNYTRSQPVEIITSSYEGLKIPTSAIRVVDGKTGVFTLNGTSVKFKSTEVLYEENGYSICALPDKNDINKISSSLLSLYDPVITAGRGLYEGKIIQ